MPRVDREKAELAVLLDRPFGEARRPAVLTREPLGERQCRVGSIQIQIQEPLPGRELLYVHIVPHYFVMCHLIQDK
jgi:hypothetical protein